MTVRLSHRALWLALFVPAAFASGLGWRAEIELHGWAGLAWLGWFHWAVPAGLAAFIAIALVVVHNDRGPGRARLTALAVALLAFGAVGHIWTRQALFALFSRALIFAPHGRALVAFGLLSLALTPLILAGMLAAVRLWPGWRRVLVANVLYVAAVPLASGALDTSAVEAVKRGWPVPLLFLALAVLFWPRAVPATR